DQGGHRDPARDGAVPRLSARLSCPDPPGTRERRRMIRANRLGVDIDGSRILADVTAHLDQPRVAVIGANGSGKSTFARALNGLARPSEGDLEVAGVDVRRDVKAAREAV